MPEIDTLYIKQLFSFVTDEQLEKFAKLGDLYAEWNEKINVISRKDIDNLFVHHILHSLAIARICTFNPNAKVLDVGTGGGFPGIPLAILFPKTKFHLIDRIGKKIKVVNAIKDALNLENVVAEQKPVEEIEGKYDFVVSRAVTGMQDFYKLTKKRISNTNNHAMRNGILYLRGDDAEQEMQDFKQYYKIYNVGKFFYNSFFDTKRIVYIPIYKK